MNETEVQDVYDTIEGVMNQFLFEVCNTETAKHIANYLACCLNIVENYDYELEANIDNHDIVIDLRIKSATSKEFTHFIGRYGDTPSIKHTSTSLKSDSISAFDRAMDVI